ncbi:MAG TPA: hypothetical protein VGO86_04735 [Candidatus Dormibacteraeota bacterium]
MLGLVIAVLVLLGLNGHGPLDLGAQATQQDLAAALAVHTRAAAVHEKGVFSRDGHEWQIDITVTRDGDGQGTVVADARKLEYRYAGGRAYVLAGQDYWSSKGRLATFFAGRWVTSSDLLTEVSTSSLSRSLSLLDVARPGLTFTHRGQPTRIGGVPAVALSDKNGDLYVSTAAPVRFLRLVSSPSYRTADGITDVRIDLDYPAGLSVQAPSPVVDTNDPSTLPAQYTADGGSLGRGRDCDVGSTCTVSVTVTNQRGPQVGSPSAEIQLTREDGSDLGHCSAPIQPVAHQQAETVSCTVSGRAWVDFTRVGGRYQAGVTVHNPFYDG